MVELWAVLGLACIDHRFRDTLEAASKESTEELQQTVERYNFRLSRYELGEVARWLKNPQFLQALREIQKLVWDDKTGPCTTGMTFTPVYIHPEPRDY